MKQRTDSTRRWGPRRVVALMGLLFCAPSLGQQSGNKPGGDEGSVVERIAQSVEDLAERAERAAEELEAQARDAAASRGVSLFTGEADEPWRALGETERVPARTVLLVHGLDEPGPIWDDLAPVLAARGREAGFAVARFDYPNDQPINVSTDLLVGALRDLRSRGATRVDLVCHSMGGLMARDALTRDGDDGYAGLARGHERLPDVHRLILVGAPNAGSPWAKLRALGEIREQIARFLDDPDHDARGLLGYLNDGLGEAGDDLLPGSEFLTDLNARPAPTGVEVTVIAGRLAPVTNKDLKWIAESVVVRQLLGREDAVAIAAGITDLSSQVGDGVVPVSSARLAGVADTVYVEANHRSMLRTVDVLKRARAMVGVESSEPPAIAVIVDRLTRPEPAER